MVDGDPTTPLRSSPVQPRGETTAVNAGDLGGRGEEVGRIDR
jgi:hypothetical protein